MENPRGLTRCKVEPVARQSRPTPAGQKPKAIIQASGNLLDRQRLYPGGRQLDGQW